MTQNRDDAQKGLAERGLVSQSQITPCLTLIGIATFHDRTWHGLGHEL
jgi:hypothetical protein